MSDKRNPYTNNVVGKSVQAGFLIFFGLCVSCCGGGISMYGDYIGPPEGLAASNRAKTIQMGIFVLIGAVIVAIGIRMVNKAKQQREIEKRDDS